MERLAAQVSPTGGTERVRTSPSMRQDWRSAAKAKMLRCNSITHQVSNQLTGVLGAGRLVVNSVV